MIALQDLLIPKFGEKNVLTHWKGSKNLLNWQETSKFEEKRAAAGRRMKSSPILGHPPNRFFVRLFVFFFWPAASNFKVAQLGG